MTNQEINRKILDNCEAIQKLTSPEMFILNEAVRDLLLENEELQSICTHDETSNDICLCCYKDLK